MRPKLVVNPLALNHPILFKIWVWQACCADSPRREIWCHGFTVADMLRMNKHVKEGSAFA